MAAIALALVGGALASCTPRDPAVETAKAPAQAPMAEADSLALCNELRASWKSLGWKNDGCDEVVWKELGRSVQGRPLVYFEAGNPKSGNTTLILSTVHGDEVTPLYLGMKLAAWMRQNKALLAESHVVIAPIVNPDSFFTKPRKRVNARGVDVNRNFPTKDWSARAHVEWKKRFKSNPRRFPGSQAGSEPETLFQQKLIEMYKPKKILSIHAPLNVVDYDGPNHMLLEKFPKDYVNECMKLRARLKAVSSGFFPGSLGNYAGQDLGIPTITLELPSADARKAEEFWKRFEPGIRTMIEFKVPSYVLREGLAKPVSGERSGS